MAMPHAETLYAPTRAGLYGKIVIDVKIFIVLRLPA
jgi:hypothetical protein